MSDVSAAARRIAGRGLALMLTCGLVVAIVCLSFGASRLPKLQSLFRHHHDSLDSLSAQSSDALETLTALPALVHLHPDSTSAYALLTSPELRFINAPVVVVLSDGVQPTRNAPGTAFLTILSPEDSALPASIINRAAAGLQTALGRQLYPLTLQTADFSAHLSEGHLLQGSRPYVIWDASSGLVLMDSNWFQTTFKQGPSAHMVGLLAEHTFQQLSPLVQAISQVGSALSGHLVVQLCTQALAVAVPAAFAAAPPLWFCILCPAVLSLIAPLLINFGLGEVASIICARLQLNDEQCFDLLMGGIGLGFVLSLASAIPIFYVCRMMECAHRNATLTKLWPVFAR